MSLSQAVTSFLMPQVNEIGHHFEGWESLIESFDYIVVFTYIFSIDLGKIRACDIVAVSMWREQFKLFQR